MSQSPLSDHSGLAAPSFYVTPNRRLSPASVLLAFVIALAVLFVVLHALRQAHMAGAGADDDDDPSRVDTIYLGDPGQAPVAARPATRPNTVHPFIVIHLPRSGDQEGEIPDTPAGHLLYSWLAAFNGPDASAVGRALPTVEAGLTEEAQKELRRQTGGFTLVSAKEVEPGVLVFRLHDQTPLATEALGTLQIDQRIPASILRFSLRSLPGSSGKLRPQAMEAR